MNKELLEKYFKNSCTEEELNSVLEWFDRSSRTTEGKAILFNLWEELADEKSNLQIDYDFILDKIHHQANLSQTKKLFEVSDQNLIKYKRRKHFLNVLSRVAAILMLPTISYGLYMSFKYQMVTHSQISVNKTYNEVFSSVDAITKVTLQDGSNIWLNHNSSLKYPAIFLDSTRNVELKGEGYFEVAPNSKKPFIVTAGGIQIRAIGTAFNVMAYPDEDKIETSLINGHVKLQRLEPNGKVITLLKMRPSDYAIYQKSDEKISSRTINDNRYFSWRDGKLVFDKEPLGEVIKKLSRWFNVDIQVKDPELLELTYTATFVNETLPQVMELMTLVSPVSYSISDRKEISPGIFAKRNVIVSYRKK